MGEKKKRKKRKIKGKSKQRKAGKETTEKENEQKT
jgi:hypothetical protein